MKKIQKMLFCAGLLLSAQAVMSQQKIVFVIKNLPPYHQPEEPVYLAGNFNNWNPGDERYRLVKKDGLLTLALDFPKGQIDYKFTRGSWDKVECRLEGEPVDNRQLKVEQDQTVEVSIIHWADHFPKAEKKHTASANVRILDTAFFMPQLNRHRRVWIYLPPGYASSRNKYPVLYMHDGQNIFDAFTSAYGEWGVDEALDTLGARYKEMIVVGIDNSSTKRMNEYAPYDMERFGKGEGDAYVDFLAKTLKPYIDRHYRTLKKAEHTFVAGSSMGGLISFYAILKYPKIFGGAGVFSPAFWVAPQIKNIDPKKAKKVKGKIYFYAGQLEGEQMVPDMLLVFDRMRLYSKADMTSVIRAEGRHNEATWRKEFPLVYKWIVLRKGDRSQN
jgi:predicted alpha/beta superfamily hydrolase